MSKIAIEFKNVSKKYGRLKVIDQLSFQIPTNSVCAFIGENGAGKTTSFALTGGFLRCDQGSVELLGSPLKEYYSMANLLGLLPQDANLYEDIAIIKQLQLLACLQGFDNRSALKEAQRVIELCNLSDKRHSSPAELSRGMKVRLGMAQALIGSPPIILLDEPTAGLDPGVQESFYKTVDALRGNTTLVISSHNLFELEALCDYVVCISSGKLVQQGALLEFKAQGTQVTYHFEDSISDLQSISASFPELHFTVRTDKALTVQLKGGPQALAALNARLLPYFLQQQYRLLTIESGGALRKLFT